MGLIHRPFSFMRGWPHGRSNICRLLPAADPKLTSPSRAPPKSRHSSCSENVGDAPVGGNLPALDAIIMISGTHALMSGQERLGGLNIACLIRCPAFYDGFATVPMPRVAKT